MTAGTDEEVARLTYELERVEEGRRRLRAALAEQRTAADAFAARAEADVIAAAGGSTGDVVAAHGDLCQSLRSRLDATSAEEDARAHDLRATCAALQLSAALASTEYRSATYPNRDRNSNPNPNPNPNLSPNPDPDRGLGRCMALPAPRHSPAPANDAGLLGSWATWLGEPPEAKVSPHPHPHPNPHPHPHPHPNPSPSPSPSPSPNAEGQG